MKAEGRCSGMRKKLKRFFSLALIVVTLLSLISVCEARRCSLSVGVGCGKITYTSYETFELKGWISNYESGPVSYDMTFTLYGPSGNKIDSWSKSGRLPPAGGWEPGEYEVCNRVIASGISCIYNKEVCTEFVKPPKPPDLVITDVWRIPARTNSTVITS